jgi:hypothetical protein
VIPLLALLGAAWANGQTTHIWITHAATEALPEGELRDLLTDEALAPMLVHGTMFPDGGYAVGHPYGEIAHWEPLQIAYLEWIRATYAPPWTDEARAHIAFLMGLASHGMADQTHDALYLDWSRRYDADAGWAHDGSLDEATDFVWSSLTGPATVPERWVPQAALMPLFDELDVGVDAETLDRAQGMLELAVGLVGIGGQNEALVAEYAAEFPWGCSHLEDPAQPGTPSFEATAVAAYWQDLYAQLHGEAGPQHLLTAWPPDGGYKPVTAASALESRVALVLARGAPTGEPAADLVTVTDAAGRAYPVDLSLYYGQNSHVLLVVPQEDWAADQDFTLTLRAATPGRDGTATPADTTLTFTTRAPVEDEAEAAPLPATSKGCATPAGPPLIEAAALLALLSRRRRPSPAPRR